MIFDWQLALRQAAAILLCLQCSLGSAATLLREVFERSQDNEIEELEIAFGTKLTLTTEFEPQSPLEFTAAARLDDLDDNADGWQFAELEFDEEGFGLKRVTIEGSAKTDMQITLEFHKPVFVQTLPMYSSMRVAVLYSPMKTYKALSRFSRSSTGRSGPVALRFQMTGAFAADALPPRIVGNRRVYRHPEQDGEVRVGFFPTETSANVVLRELRGTYPDINLIRVSAAEIEFAKHFNLFTDRVLAKPTRANRNEGTPPQSRPSLSLQAMTPGTIKEAPVAQPEESIVRAKPLDRSDLELARDAFLDGELDRAIALYTKAAEDTRLRMEALEMLGVAREKNGQLAHAKANYERFLAAYPDTAGSNRVQQRLQALVGHNPRTQNLRGSKKNTNVAWNVIGNVAQFYRRYSLEIDDRGETIPVDALFTDLTTIARKSTDHASHEARISIGHMADFSDREDPRDIRVHRLYWESYFDKLKTGFKVGRQSKNNAGVLGRYDGATFSYRPTDSIQLNALGGYLVNSTFDGLNGERPVYGINAELQFLDGSLELAPFYVEQRRDDVLDRRAVGLSSFYMSEKFTVSSLVDYDIFHQALNNIYATASYNLNREWRIHGAYDFRRSPYLTTSNALIGQRYNDLSEFERSLIDLQLEDIAEDRTATSNLARIGIDGKFNDTWSMSLDASMSKFSETDASAGINALESRSDFYFTAQLRATDLFSENSYSSIQLRYLESDTAKTSMLYFANRFVWGRWLFHPKLVMSERTSTRRSQNQLQVRPSLRLDYKAGDRFRLEFELGYDWTKRETTFQEIDMQGTYVRLGYRVLFLK